MELIWVLEKALFIGSQPLCTLYYIKMKNWIGFDDENLFVFQLISARLKSG